MNKVQFHRIPTTHQPTSHFTKEVEKTNGFERHLQNALDRKNQLKVSKHATARLEERNIRMTDAEWMRIATKVDEAKKKGVNESLVLTSNAAMIISAKNNTVITAMNRKEATEQIFTNIDGTIILPE